MSDSASDAPTRQPCPICGKPSVVRYVPFCSARCGQIDLGRWLVGRYVVETEEGDERLQDEE
ncbi:MAG: DNA gyrase inhibitor YacG [Aliidongia sp.]